MLMFLLFWESHPTYDQTQGSSVVFLTILLYIFNDQIVFQSQMN
jgi:hypothetical protein